MMNKLFSAILLLYSALCFSQSNTQIEQQIDQLFNGYNTETPGVAVAVVKGGNVVFKKGYGSANLEYDIPIHPSTVFHIASVSKQFTAFAIYLLAEEGKIDLSNDIRTYFPELPEYEHTVRIRHLLAHTSGLKDQWALLTLAGWQMEDVITTNQILKLVAAQTTLNFEPGTRFMYSNTGYTLLAELVARVSGKSFSDFTRERIFEPLGMQHSQFYEDYHQLIKGRAYSYEKIDDTYFKKKLNYATVGATSMMTTVEDMAKWAVNFNDLVIGNEKLISEFNEISALEDGSPVIWSILPGDTTYHAKGQLHYLYKGLNVISHGGHDAGYRANLARFPDQGISIIALSNDEHYNIFGTMTAIAEVFLKDQFKELPMPETTPAPSSEEAVIPQLNFNDYLGVYKSTELATSYEVKLINEELVLVHPRLDDVVLEPKGKDRFTGRLTFPVEVNFIRRGKSITGLEVSNFGAKNVRFAKELDHLRSFEQESVHAAQGQLDAYNNGDIDAFLQWYHEDVQLYNFPNNKFGEGTDFMRNSYAPFFESNPDLHCTLVKRMVLGDTVIDRELVTGIGENGTLEAIAIYKIKEGKISTVYFLRL